MEVTWNSTELQSKIQTWGYFWTHGVRWKLQNTIRRYEMRTWGVSNNPNLGVTTGNARVEALELLYLKYLAPGILWSALGLRARCQNTMTGWDSKFDLRFLSQCGSTYNCLSRSVPEIHQLVAGTSSNQLTTKTKSQSRRILTTG